MPVAKNGELVYGIQSVLESLKADHDIERILIQRSARNEGIREIILAAKERGIPVNQVPLEKLNRITRKNHQGAISFTSSIRYASLDHLLEETYAAGETPVFLALDRVTDVRNFGAIARSAECMGVKGIVIPDKGSAQIGQDAMKTSSGALNYIPICRSADFLAELKFLKESGLKIVTATEKATQPIFEAPLTDPCVIVMGSEEDGVSKEVRELADFEGMIPMTGQVQSMNVSAATAVVLYEVVRQRNI